MTDIEEVNVAPDAEAATMFAYGHSHLASDVGCSPGARYIEQLRARHEMAVVNRAVNGFLMSDACYTAMTGPDQWVVGTKGVVVVDAVIGDVVYAGGGTVAMRRCENALRSLLALLSADAFYADNSDGFTYTGGWTDLTSTSVFGGGTNQTSTPGDYVDIAFEGDAITLLTSGFDAAVAQNASFTIEDGGTVRHAYTARSEATQHGQLVRGFVNRVVPLTGFGAGSQLIRVRHTGAPGDRLTIDGILVPSTSPPPVLVMMPLYIRPAAYALGGKRADDATVDAYAALISEVVAASPNAFAVDARSGWDPFTMTNSMDGVHPNDRGHTHIADAVEGTLAGLDLGSGAGAYRSVDDGQAGPRERLHLARAVEHTSVKPPFRARARRRVARELFDGTFFASDLWSAKRPCRERWYVIGDSNAYVLRPVRNAILRLRVTSLHRMGQPGEAGRMLAEALRWHPEHHDTALGALAQVVSKPIRFPMPTAADVAVISYGELDIRTHVRPQVVDHGRSLDEVLDALADGAITLMEHYETCFPGRTAFLSIKPPAGEVENPDGQCTASIRDRADWTLDLNRRIAARTEARAFTRVAIADFWDDVVGPDGALPPELSDDYVHLKPSCFRIVRDAVRRTVAALPRPHAAPARESLGAPSTQAP